MNSSVPTVFTKDDISFLNMIYDSHKNDDKKFVVLRTTFMKDPKYTSKDCLNDRQYKTFVNFDDAKEYAGYLSDNIVKFSHGYYDYSNYHHSAKPRVLTDILIYVIHKNKFDYCTKYLVTKFKSDTEITFV